MIKLATKETTPLVRQMWKTCFGDSDEFMDLYFSKKYVEENTLIYFDGETAAASLQMLPGEITFCGERVPYYYMSGLCTLPEYRKRGYMAELIYEAHRMMVERGIPLAILIPAEDWLYTFYEKYGYEKVFEEDGKSVVSLKELLDNSSSIKEAYKEFDAIYGMRDFCVQKSFEDFQVIIEETRMNDFPEKENLPGMACITDVKRLLDIYAKKHSEKDFTLLVDGVTYEVRGGRCRQGMVEEPYLTLTIGQLCRLLFGFHTSELGEDIVRLFPEQHTVMNLMLE